MTPAALTLLVAHLRREGRKRSRGGGMTGQANVLIYGSRAGAGADPCFT